MTTPNNWASPSGKLQVMKSGANLHVGIKNHTGSHYVEVDHATALLLLNHLKSVVEGAV